MSMIDPVVFNRLRRFRAGAYGAFGARRDALFDLLDAATVAGLVPSLAHLSLTAVQRRRWGSLDDALAVGTLVAITGNIAAPSAARVSAAKTILDFAVKGVELVDLAERVEALASLRGRSLHGCAGV